MPRQPATPPFSISVIIPVYNGEQFVAEAIQSVLAQTTPPSEIIVVDDGSTDATAQVVADLAASASMPLRYVYQANQGPAAARNVGIRRAEGDTLAFLDADDLWVENTLAIQIGQLAANPTEQIVWGVLQMFRVEAGQRLVSPTMAHHANLGSVVMRKSALERVGLFDERLHRGEDLEWFLRARDCRLTWRFHSEVVLWYRWHGENIWLGKPDPGHGVMLAMRTLLEKRRRRDSQPPSPAGAP